MNKIFNWLKESWGIVFAIVSLGVFLLGISFILFLIWTPLVFIFFGVLGIFWLSTIDFGKESGFENYCKEHNLESKK